MAAVLAASALASSPAAAWSPKTQVAIAEAAAGLAPPDLARQIERYRRDLRDGSLDPFRSAAPEFHVRTETTGRLDQAVIAEADRAVAMIRGHRPFAEIVRQLGVVSHYVADLGDPLAASDADPLEPRYNAGWSAYVEGALGRIARAFYGVDGDVGATAGVPALIGRGLARSRELYPLIGREVRRVRPGGDGPLPFDDRSTAFAISALAFNNAVTDVAVVMRAIWLEAGGVDERRWLPPRGELVVLLPRPAAAGGGRPEAQSPRRRPSGLVPTRK